jgi:hypothetical protein
VVRRSVPRTVWTDAWRLGDYLLPGDSLDAEAGKLNFKALLRQRVRCAALPLPAAKRPILPWALFPFKVPHLSLPVPVGNRFPDGEQSASGEHRKRCSSGVQEIPPKVRLERWCGKPHCRALLNSKVAEATLDSHCPPKRSATTPWAEALRWSTHIIVAEARMV